MKVNISSSLLLICSDPELFSSMTSSLLTLLERFLPLPSHLLHNQASQGSSLTGSAASREHQHIQQVEGIVEVFSFANSLVNQAATSPGKSSAVQFSQYLCETES
jgi:hypothetical protein